MKLKKRTLCLAVVLAMIATLLVPISASAETLTWEPPASAKDVDVDVVTVAGHAANSTAVHYLGANMVTARTSDMPKDLNSITTELGVFGTDINDSPDPYFWNYFYNLSVDADEQVGDTVKMVSANPMGADLTPVSGYEDLTISGRDQVPHSIGMKPDILLGIQGSNGKTYDDYIALMKDDYNPQQVAYKAGSLADFVDDMYNLSDAIKKSGKEGRYGDTEAIAKNYEAYIKGLQLYVMSEIAAGNVEKKTVAVVDPSSLSDGQYLVYNSSVSKGTAASCRAAEYVENTTKNIIDVCGIKNSGTDGSPKYLADAEDLLKADAIYITVQAQINMTEEEFVEELAEALDVDESEIPPVYAYDPNGAFTIRANSVENFVGIGQYQGFLYPEILNPVYAYTYVCEKFYHVSNPEYYKALTETALANASLPEGYEADAAGYSADYIDSRIQQGLAYYYNNEDLYSNTKLAPTERLSSSDYSYVNLAVAKVEPVADQLYTGQAIKPEVTVTLGGKTLEKGTDYTVAWYKNNINTGTATMKLKGLNTTTGTRIVTFKIVKNDIKSGVVSGVSQKAYTGKALKPAVTVKYNGKTLTNGSDYTVSYKNNVKPGKATITITGKGSYTGTKSVTFNIAPKKETISKLTSAKKATLAVTWKKDTGATGYEVQIAKNSKFTSGLKKVTVTKNSTTTKTFTKLSKGKKYYVRVRAYKTIDGHKVYGSFSTVKTKTVKK